MMIGFDDNDRVVEVRLREVQAHAEQARLVRLARRARPRYRPRWRRRLGAALIAAGESLIEPALDVVLDEQGFCVKESCITA